MNKGCIHLFMFMNIRWSVHLCSFPIIYPGVCSCCFASNETTDHLFASCHLATMIWQHISSWCRIPSIQATSFVELASLHEDVPGNDVKRKAIQAIIMVTCWSIWKARNDFIFSNIPIKVSNIIGEIKILSFLWVRSRSKKIGVDWKKWKCFSL